jgi:Arc/MetJ-type ribon-helix-helix transcriptional regulator
MSRRFNKDEVKIKIRSSDRPFPPLPEGADRIMLLRAERGGPRDSVVGCRVDPADLEAIDMLVEAGLLSSRSEAAAWLIRQGVQAQKALLDELSDTVAQIRKLREDAKAKVGKLVEEENAST